MQDNPYITQYKLFNECNKISQEITFLVALDQEELLTEGIGKLAMEKSSIPDLTNTLLHYITEAEGLEEITAKEIAKLIERKNRFKKRAHTMRESIKQIFDKFGINKLEAPFGTVSLALRKNANLRVTDEGALLRDHPDLWIRQDPKLNKAALRKLLENGEIIEGVELQDRTMLVIRK